MRRIGRKGEKTGNKKTLYLQNLWNETLRKASEESGKSQSEITEWCLSASLEEFRERFCPKDQESKSDKEKEKNLDMEEAFKLTKKEFVAYAQRSSERRKMQDIIFGEHESGAENFMKDVAPQGILDRILGRGQGHRENEEWKED